LLPLFKRFFECHIFFVLGGERGRSIDDIDLTPKEPPCPNGCKEFYDYYNGKLFKCYASNEKNFIRKFKKWKEEQDKLTNQLNHQK